jgi:hypothetical protein
MPPTAVDYVRILPEIVLSVWGMIVMFIEPILPAGRSRKGLGIFSAVGALTAIAATFYQAQPQFAGFGFTSASSFILWCCSSPWPPS